MAPVSKSISECWALSTYDEQVELLKQIDINVLHSIVEMQRSPEKFNRIFQGRFFSLHLARDYLASHVGVQLDDHRKETFVQDLSYLRSEWGLELLLNKVPVQVATKYRKDQNHLRFRFTELVSKREFAPSSVPEGLSLSLNFDD